MAQGLYTANWGALTRIADTSIAVPGGSGNFTGFGNIALNDDIFAFLGFSSSSAGIYSNISGTLAPVIDLSELLDGKTLLSLALSQFSIDSGEIVFRAAFTDETSGIFVASMVTPVPPALPLFATGLGALGLLGWRRKQKLAA